MDLYYHFARELYYNDKLHVKHVLTADIIADSLIKPLIAVLFNDFIGYLGLLEGEC